MLAGARSLVGVAKWRSSASPRMGVRCTRPYTWFSLVANELCQQGAPFLPSFNPSDIKAAERALTLTSMWTFRSNITNIQTFNSAALHLLQRAWRFSGSRMASSVLHWIQWIHQSKLTMPTCLNLTLWRTPMWNSSTHRHQPMIQRSDKLLLLAMVDAEAAAAHAGKDNKLAILARRV